MRAPIRLLLVLALLQALPGARPLALTPLAPRFEIDARLGFGDTIVAGHWMPLQVSVLNHGAHHEALLEVRIPRETALHGALRGIRGHTVYSRVVSLPAATLKRFEFTVPVAGIVAPVVIRLLDRDGLSTLSTTFIAPRDLRQAERVLLVAGADADLDYLNDQQRALQVQYVHPERLPRHWRAYESVQGLVLHGVSMDVLDPDQYQALYRWLAQGGLLVVAADPNYGLLRSRRLAGWLPALPEGTVRIADAAALRPAFGAALPDAPAFVIHRLPALISGRVLLRGAGHTLVSERRLGLGRVLYLSFDIGARPFAGWPGLRERWVEWLQQPIDASSSSADDGTAMQSLLDGAWRGFPGHIGLLLFATVYVVALLTLSYLTIGGSRRGGSGRWRRGRPAPAATPRRLWASAPLIAPLLLVLGFSVAAHLLFGRWLFQPGAGLMQLSTVRLLGDLPLARIHHELGLYWTRRPPAALQLRVSSPAYELGRAPLATTAHAVTVRQPSVTGLRVELGPPARLSGIDQRPYDLLLADALEVRPYERPAALTARAEGVHVLLDEVSGARLGPAVLAFRGTLYRLPTSIDGGEVERPLSGLPVLTRLSSPAQATADLARHYVELLPVYQRNAARQLIETTLRGDRFEQTLFAPAADRALLLASTDLPLFAADPDSAVATPGKRLQARITLVFDWLALPSDLAAGGVSDDTLQSDTD
ncbi:MAG: hypothetical protein KDK91_01075 [Gammaproteobacteria bacterium]|nr:hypothetical protein [Gammaproteobacteria bacterium]